MKNNKTKRTWFWYILYKTSAAFCGLILMGLYCVWTRNNKILFPDTFMAKSMVFITFAVIIYILLLWLESYSYVLKKKKHDKEAPSE
jgi:hypothetical protein